MTLGWSPAPLPSVPPMLCQKQLARGSKLHPRLSSPSCFPKGPGMGDLRSHPSPRMSLPGMHLLCTAAGFLGYFSFDLQSCGSHLQQRRALCDSLACDKVLERSPGKQVQALKCSCPSRCRSIYMSSGPMTVCRSWIRRMSCSFAFLSSSASFLLGFAQGDGVFSSAFFQINFWLLLSQADPCVLSPAPCLAQTGTQPHGPSLPLIPNRVRTCLASRAAAGRCHNIAGRAFSP